MLHSQARRGDTPICVRLWSGFRCTGFFTQCGILSGSALFSLQGLEIDFCDRTSIFFLSGWLLLRVPRTNCKQKKNTIKSQQACSSGPLSACQRTEMYLRGARYSVTFNIVPLFGMIET